VGWRMAMRLSTLLVLALAACAAAGPPRGPSYTPTNSPEAPSACPAEAAAAKAAREAALGTDDQQALAEKTSSERLAATRAVFAQAECERAVFERLPLDSSDPDEFKRQITRAREQFYTAKNLFDEVVAASIPEWSVAAYTRLGDLHAGYVAKLRRADPGPLVAADRLAWSEEIESVVAPVEREAAKAYDKALGVVDMGPERFAGDAQVAPYVTAACQALERLDRQAWTRHRCQ
jgi:hypothetical protein